MESFALIKYWRPSAAETGGGTTILLTGDPRATTNTTLDPAPSFPCSHYADDDGPYIDLEFTPSRETPLNTETETVSENAVEFEAKGPLVCLFAREINSKKKTNETELSKESVHSYFKLLRPVQKVKFSGGGISRPCKEEQSNVKSARRSSNLQAGIEVVRKRLGKSRSISGKVVAAPPRGVGSGRRDDSLLQREDGIQGAILHCKRSFNASRDGEFGKVLSRSVSDPTNDKSVTMSPSMS